MQAGFSVPARKRINLSVAGSVSLYGSTWKRLELEGIVGACAQAFLYREGNQLIK